MDSTELSLLNDYNLDWVTLVSWGYQDDYNTPEVRHHYGDSVQIEKHNDHWIDQIKRVRSEGFKVFFKPHLSQHTQFQSDIGATAVNFVRVGGHP